MRKRDETSLVEALEEYFEHAGIKKRVRQASIINEWSELVGARIAEVTQPQSISQTGILFVKVRSAAWMQELQLMTPAIVKQLRENGKRVRNIYWHA